MTYINAKFLRENLQQIVEEVANENKEYTIIYRSKPLAKLVPINHTEEQYVNVDELLELGSSLGTATDSKHYKDDKKTLIKRLMEKYG